MRRLLDLHWWRSISVLAAVAVIGIVASGVAGAYFATLNSNQIDENHQLICTLDRLFGLDRDLTPAQKRKLRPTQRAALASIIDACPELGRKGAP